MEHLHTAYFDHSSRLFSEMGGGGEDVLGPGVFVVCNYASYSPERCLC